MGNIDGLDRAVAQLEKQAYDQSEGNNVRSALHVHLAMTSDVLVVIESGAPWTQCMRTTEGPRLEHRVCATSWHLCGSLYKLCGEGLWA